MNSIKVKNVYRIARFYPCDLGEGSAPVPVVGDAVFLGRFQGEGGLDCLQAQPEMFETNSSHQTRLRGWCGTNNGTATYAVGAGIVTAVLGERDGVDTRWGHEGNSPEPYVSLRVRLISDDDALDLPAYR